MNWQVQRSWGRGMWGGYLSLKYLENTESNSWGLTSDILALCSTDAQWQDYLFKIGANIEDVVLDGWLNYKPNEGRDHTSLPNVPYSFVGWMNKYSCDFHKREKDFHHLAKNKKHISFSASWKTICPNIMTDIKSKAGILTTEKYFKNKQNKWHPVWGMPFSFFYKSQLPQTEICHLTGTLSVDIWPSNQCKHLASLRFLIIVNPNIMEL